MSNPLSGRLFGATLLITGCCIGAGMLGLPAVASLTGFIPSTLLFFAIWMFMLVTGLLVLEVNLWFKDDVNFMSMAERTLGKWGKGLCAFLYLFLFYSLMVAYISGCGTLVADFTYEILTVEIPDWMGSLISSLVLAVVLYLGTAAVDNLNRLFMIGLVLSYLLLITIGLPHINISSLEYQDWDLLYLAIPVMVISFGYHNLIPTITNYLDHKKRPICIAIIIGSMIPLGVYLLWNGLIMGLIPVEGSEGFRNSIAQGDMVTRALRSAAEKPWINDLVEYFAFFALVTSFLAIGLSLVDFLADGFKMTRTHTQRLILTLAAVVPPLVFALIYPTIFLLALNYAGGFSAVILFGILPVLMVWRGRYIEKLAKTEIIPGGKLVLAIILIMSCIIVLSQLVQELVKIGGNA